MASSLSENNEPSGRRPTWAGIDLAALASNFQIIKGQVGRDVKVMAVVKADAYGHGASQCALRLEQEGADWFGVALPEEGMVLRNAGVAKPILCLGGFWEGQAPACIRHALTPVIYRLDMAEALNAAARDAGMVTDVHVKVDTGMGRLGIRSEDVAAFCAGLSRLKNLRVDGLMTHFAAADEKCLDDFTAAQLKHFNEAVAIFKAHGFAAAHQHMANSAATFGHPETHGNMVRPGGALYGLCDTLPAGVDASALRPVMSLHSNIILLKWIQAGEPVGYGCTFKAARRTLVATIPLGYEDGYRRALSNLGRVIVRGAYAAVIGRISMDLTLIDVTEVAEVALGDKVTMLGRNGELSISAEELAQAIGTISYEITCGVSDRVPRVCVT
ncbi:MAG: alanine racemase [Blastocatellia bacterium]|jgi:alanine racemase|nr:alanine racemase [Blastocatellia bacterium]